MVPTSVINDVRWQVAQTLSFVYTRYALVVALTVVLLEYFQLIEAEKTLVWPLKWSIFKFLFVINRYLPLIYASLWVVYVSAPASTSVSTCQVLFDVPTVFLVIGMLCADAVFYFRLYALSQQSRTMMIVLIANYLLVSLSCSVCIAFWIRSQSFVPSPHLLPLTTCFRYGTTAIWSTIVYGALLYNSFFTTALALWYGIKLYYNLRPVPVGTLIKIIYRDGATYFVCIATISLANAFITFFPPIQYRLLLASGQAMVHNVLATRMILHLREVAEETLVIDSRLHPTRGHRKEFVDNPWHLSSRPVELSGFEAAGNWSDSFAVSRGTASSG
ncbi:hypothetical protein BKA70DRAFT_1563459 [Coprinopsis sp. MPI-PUGE-AT-0042]|nr:hypothetical protein BKA70DRAFT_1563459 [Coprinopsis sp. MPI-PUGE-AT-0042]